MGSKQLGGNMPVTSMDSTVIVGVRSDSEDFQKFRETIQRKIEDILPTEMPIFTTDASHLFENYLANLDIDYRQEHNCYTCKKFFETYGGLVTICPKTGIQYPLLWSDNLFYGSIYYKSTQVLNNIVRNAKITGVFYDNRKLWGTEECGGWRHLFIIPKPFMILKDKLRTPEQAMTEKLEDYGILSRFVNLYRIEHLEKAIEILNLDILYRADKVIGPIQWLLNLKKLLTSKVAAHHKNKLIWSAAATAPPGFCHIRSSMAGTLLDDILDGLPLEEIKRKFDAKMQPDRYLRPQAPATAGNAVQGEKIIEKLGCAKSLERRLVRLNEIKYFWLPAPFHLKTCGPRPTSVFKDVVPEPPSMPGGVGIDGRPGNPPPAFITWRKFKEKILPLATQIELMVDNRKLPFTAFTTAVHADAPPILKWDSEKKRNPVCTYSWVGGSLPSQWNIKPNIFNEVIGICFAPSAWNKEFPDHDHVILLLRDAKDSRCQDAGLALFPECLINELHSIRSTIESFSKKGRLQEVGNPACGITYGKDGWNARIRVKTKHTTLNFIIDRFE
jgi:hypothetical protein